MAALTDEDRAILAPALGDDAAEVIAEVEAGAAKCLIYPDGSRIVLRLEGRAPRQELVIVAGAGADAIGKVGELCALADAHGWSLRFHTQRPALGAMLARLGFHESERVYRYGRQ